MARKRRPPRPRFIKPTAGYTTRPMREFPLVHDEFDFTDRDAVERIASASSIRDEPEMIGPAIVDGYAEIAQFQHSQQHMADVLAAQQTRPLIKAEDRLKDIHRRAKHSHVDLSHEIHIMTRDLEKARRRGQPDPAHTLDRLGKVEGLLDGIAA